MNRRAVALSLALIVFSSLAAAQVPQLNVVPDGVDRNVSAYNRHEFEFSFTNQDSSRKIYNVTLENTSYLTWERNRFNLNASQTRTVNASFYTENITSINDVLESNYKYSGSDNDFSGPNISIEASTFYRNTSISVEPFGKSFELPFGESDSSVFRVENTGSETAFNVTVEGEDIKFGKSGFSVPPGEDVLVQYNVSIPKPEDNATAATNQTYSRKVQVSGENFNETEFTASIFVPFKQYDTEEAERSFADDIINFCNTYPNSKFCTGEKLVKFKNVTETVFKVRNNMTFNNTQSEKVATFLANWRDWESDIIDRMKLWQNTIRSERERTRQNFSEGFEQTQRNIKELKADFRSLNQSIKETNERRLQIARNRLFWRQLEVGIIVFALLVGLSWWIYQNKDDWTRDGGWK